VRDSSNGGGKVKIAAALLRRATKDGKPKMDPPLTGAGLTAATRARTVSGRLSPSAIALAAEIQNIRKTAAARRKSGPPGTQSSLAAVTMSHFDQSLHLIETNDGCPPLNTEGESFVMGDLRIGEFGDELGSDARNTESKRPKKSSVSSWRRNELMQTTVRLHANNIALI
jgi:hypothetical protein